MRRSDGCLRRTQLFYPGRGGPHRIAHLRRWDRGVVRGRCAPRVSAQAGFFGPTTLRLRPWTPACPSRARGLLSAQWKPGYHGPARQGPRHSSEDFVKSQALQAWRASRGVFPREVPLLERFPRGVPLDSAKDRAELREAPGPREGSFRAKLSLPPAAERTWDDVRGAIVILVLKAVNKAASSQGGLRPRHFCDKEDACTAGVTMDGPTDLCSANHRPGWTVAFQL